MKWNKQKLAEQRKKNPGKKYTQQIDLAWILAFWFGLIPSVSADSCGKSFDPRFRYHVQQS